MRRLVAIAGLSVIAAIAVVPAVSADDDGDAGGSANPLTPAVERSSRFVPKPAGTKETLKFWFGPYTVPPGHDANRVDVDLPVQNGFIVSIEPGMKRVADLSEPSHQEAHIHHAHWFALDPGNQEDNYTYGNTEWIFGNGDEETKADFSERSAADPKGPQYGEFIGAEGPQAMIYMLHNKTNQPLPVYIALDVTFVHGTAAELKTKTGRDWHDVSGVLFGRTFDVPREKKKGDGRFSTTDDMKTADGKPRPIEWVSTLEGTMIGTGSHVHPGGLRVHVENMGSKENPCPNDRAGPGGGTQLLRSDALWRDGVTYSEDFQMEVSHPAWRAPIHKGDRLRITGIYENAAHAWWTAMTHEGTYIDEQQKPRGRCKPYFVGPAARLLKPSVKRVRRGGKVRRVRQKPARRAYDGVPNRPWHGPKDKICGEAFGGPPCERPYQERGEGLETSLVHIANFLYLPGDRALSGQQGAPARVKKGATLTFVNEDQQAGIRHSVTTCKWPCAGPYVGNYPWADGAYESGTLGYDPIDGGTPNPVASTPPDLPVGKYSYFCRVHPWMRGAFEVTP